MSTQTHRLLLLVALHYFGTSGAETLYKSVDDQGRVTYSSHPPADAVEVEGVQLVPGPSTEEAEQARERVEAMERDADMQYRELMERRQKEAEAKEEAELERVAKETAERQKRIDESLQRLENERSYAGPYPWGWPRPYPPYPPIHPPFPPKPVHPISPPNRPYEDHINPATRNR